MRSRTRWKWGVIFGGDNLSMVDLPHYAQMAEEAGADSVWSVEVWCDAFVPLTAMASVTHRVRVGTGSAQVARPPMHTELSAQSLAEVSGGDLCWGWAPPLRSGTANGTGSRTTSRSPACGSTSNASARCGPPAPRTR
jgi:alkanesulfonate monooxygenase SsuD/methylene tetrahydromethanopterin reductase-like flavin-dependent oxidoreductase (luciferase family)